MIADLPPLTKHQAVRAIVRHEREFGTRATARPKRDCRRTSRVRVVCVMHYRQQEMVVVLPGEPTTERVERWNYTARWVAKRARSGKVRVAPWTKRVVAR